MVTTRNRSKSGMPPSKSVELPTPTRARRTRLSKPLTMSITTEESETVESSSATSSPDSLSPSQEGNLNFFTDADRYGDQPKQEIDDVEDKRGSSSEEEDDDHEDLEKLLVKAHQSLKKRALHEEKEEPRFSFPKLETGLNTRDVYIKQESARAKVDVNAVVVVEKGASGPRSALETCEVNMNAQKVHTSKRQRKEEREKTTGKGWFDLPQQVMTPELKRDLQILKLRNVLDPKRFYKREEKGKPKFPKYFQVGTIVEGNTEFYSSRLTKKERATTITGEVMKDLTGRDYYKRKFNEIQEAKQSGGKRSYKKGSGKQSKSWHAGK